MLHRFQISTKTCEVTMQVKRAMRRLHYTDYQYITMLSCVCVESLYYFTWFVCFPIVAGGRAHVQNVMIMKTDGQSFNLANTKQEADLAQKGIISNNILKLEKVLLWNAITALWWVCFIIWWYFVIIWCIWYFVIIWWYFVILWWWWYFIIIWRCFVYDDTLSLYDDTLSLYDDTLSLYDDSLLLYDYTLSLYDDTL